MDLASLPSRAGSCQRDLVQPSAKQGLPRSNWRSTASTSCRSRSGDLQIPLLPQDQPGGDKDLRSGTRTWTPGTEPGRTSANVCRGRQTRGRLLGRSELSSMLSPLFHSSLLHPENMPFSCQCLASCRGHAGAASSSAPYAWGFLETGGDIPTLPLPCQEPTSDFRDLGGSNTFHHRHHRHLPPPGL